MRPGRSGSGGFAIVVVLWMAAALSLLAVGIAAGVRADVRSSQLLKSEVQAAAVGDAAIQLAVLGLKMREAQPGQAEHAHYVFDEHEVDVFMQSASGFINLNSAPETLLQDLFVFGAGVEPGAAATLAARVLDWRDADHSASAMGAEDDAYVQGGSRFRTRGAPFEAPADVLQVLGMDLDVYDKIQNFITIHGDSPGVDPLSASDGVLSILAHGNSGVVQRISELRDQGSPGIDTTSLVQSHLAAGGGTIYRMEARVRFSGQLWSRARWVDVGQAEAGGLPWRTLEVMPVRGVSIKGGPDDS